MSKFDPSKIVFISHPLSRDSSNLGLDSLDYFASLSTNLIKNLQSKFQKADIVVKIPGSISNDFNKDQLNFIKSIGNDVDYVVISPFDFNYFFENIEDIQKLIKEKKLIFIDQGFEFISEEQKYKLAQDQHDTPPYVQANWFQGGEIAGEIAFNYLESKKIKSPHIVILEGDTGSINRVNGFESYLITKSNAGDFYPSFFKFNAGYSKLKAKDFFSKYLNEAINSANPIDIIFTTNDEMGLGVREALIDKQQLYIEKISNNRNGITPKIIGFDGILDFTILIDNSQEDFVYDTVVVDIKSQIDKVINIIEHYNKIKSDIANNQLRIKSNCYSFRSKLNTTKKANGSK